MTKERRRAGRFAIEQMVELSYGRETFVHASGINLSRTGLLCKTDTFLEPYTEVSIVLNFPVDGDTRRIECSGIVIRSVEENGDFKTGISLSALSNVDAETLTAYLKIQEPTAESE